ncbi:alpha-2A adrenergic receptor-like [Branchiostoma floridae]|uniref:Alpha-2A adrenergic receptor-like n=1 Tax=Branchiostoma floridae TaxID=7739 RepID=A0A9J7HTE0_BRAFL|nr:alpha-2A adrenergic receptor-like [Branchiostoma floridae]
MKGVQNLFLVSLACSDVTVGTLVMPFKLANELMGYWYFGQTWCDIYLALDVFACTASIFNLCAISIDRYWAITKPIKYLSMRTRRRVGIMIAIVWMSSALVCLPPLFGWKSGDDSGDEQEASETPGCQLNSSPGYVVFSSVSSFYIPLGVLIFVYTSIIRAVRKRFKFRNKNAVGQCPSNTSKAKDDGPGPSKWKPQPPSDSEDSIAWANRMYVSNVSSDLSDTLQRPEKELQVLEALQPLKSPGFSPRGPYFDGKMVVLPTKTTPIVDNVSVMVTNNSRSADALTRLPEVEVVQPRTDPKFPRSDVVALNPINKDAGQQVPGPSGVKLHLFQAKRSKDSGNETEDQKMDKSSRLRRRKVREKLRAAQQKERKSLSIIFCVVSVFLICWLPFFVCYLVVTLCESCWVPPPLFMFVEWMGYGNSALNPVIYALFNKEFRDGVKMLFRRNNYSIPLANT